MRIIWIGTLAKLIRLQLYEEDARIGHREFDLKLTHRVKMSMVRGFLVNSYVVFIRSAVGRRTRDILQFLGCVSLALWRI